MKLVPRSALGLLLSIGCASAAEQEHIGSWVLSCPGEGVRQEPCVLRLDKRFLDKAGVTGDLEIQARGKALVPVLALRGLPGELLLAAAMAGQTDASVQFGGGPRQGLSCAPSGGAYICSPQDDAVAKLAAGLLGARSVTVRVSVTVTGLKPLPVQEKSLDLIGTGEALARLRAAGSSGVPGGPMTTSAPSGVAAMADKVLKAAGYPNGVADLEALLAKYRGK
jgi:hypothetical protein